MAGISLEPLVGVSSLAVPGQLRLRSAAADPAPVREVHPLCQGLGVLRVAPRQQGRHPPWRLVAWSTPATSFAGDESAEMRKTALRDAGKGLTPGVFFPAPGSAGVHLIV